jgi:protein-disulfide isomerase
MTSTDMRRIPLIVWSMVAAIVCLPPAGLSADPDVLAVVEGRPITLSDIEQPLRITLYDLEMEKYRLVRRRLEQGIAEGLLARAAAAEGKSISAYVTEQIQDQITEVSDADVEARYQQLQASGVAGLQGSPGAPNEKAKEDIKNLLVRERAGKGLQALIERLAATAGVSVQMRPPDPPVVPLSSGDDPALGPATALVTITEFSDFQCPVCKESVPILKQLQSLYPEQVRLVYRDFPLPSHPQARPAAEAAHCAYEQQQFWTYHDALFAQAPNLKPSDYLQLAQSVGLNPEDFATCLSSGRSKTAVNRDIAEGRSIGLSATPTFFVNGRYLSGFQTLDVFREIIDRELAEVQNKLRAQEPPQELLRP